jgi:UDP-N-acetylmuramoyl-L-alanyl-D-glutamate--2,6-diaminopimelate ligase
VTVIEPLRPAVSPVPLTTLGFFAPGAATGVTLDSRSVRPGDVYVALTGSRTHGARFAAGAVAQGAVAILTDEAGAEQARATGVPVLVDPVPRLRMAEIAAEVYGRPADRLRMLGVTGTNGKTSTVALLEEGLCAAGTVAGSIGTLGFRVAGRQLPTSRTTITTPESPDLQALLAAMEQRGAQAVAMEVSSHALAQDRVAPIVFDVAGFTMLGRDHLEYHHTMEEYFAAKARLFDPARSRHQVIDADDPWGRRLIAHVRALGGDPLTTGAGADADFRIVGHRVAAPPTTVVDLATPAGRIAFPLALPGEFNVRNATIAVAMLTTLGVDVAAALPGISAAQVPGRMQRVVLEDGSPNVVVDFAHTPEAIEASLRALPGRIVAVVGGGGDRDSAKRGPMGAAAARYADVVVVTDDNPRTEDPAGIRAAILEGARHESDTTGRGVRVIECGDRRAAIALALDEAAPGDWVAILGKGHEQGQTVGTEVIPFDDVTVVREAWNKGN